MIGRCYSDFYDRVANVFVAMPYTPLLCARPAGAIGSLRLLITLAAVRCTGVVGRSSSGSKKGTNKGFCTGEPARKLRKVEKKGKHFSYQNDSLNPMVWRSWIGLDTPCIPGGSMSDGEPEESFHLLRER